MIQEFLSQTNFAGRDGFYWWIGQIETEKGTQQKNSDDRYKVRIVGQHLKDCNAVAHDDLPWAIVMMPATAPRREGNTDYESVKYKSGDWVIGFFLDGKDGQRPVILGSIGQQVNATQNINKDKPSTAPCLAFTTFLDPDVNPQTGIPSQQNSSIQQSGTDGTKGGTNPSGSKPDLRGNVNASNDTASTALLGTKCCNSDTNPGGQYFCVEVSDAKCTDATNDQSKMQQILTDLFSNVSNNSGSFGQAITSKYTGKLYNYVGLAQGYINKLNSLMSLSVARIKGEVFALIKQGSKEILDFLLTTEVIDTDATTAAINAAAAAGKDTSTVKPVKKRVGRMSGLTQWLNDQLKQVNCQIADLDKRLMDFLTDLIFGYLDQAFNAARCLIDSIVQDILNQISSFLDSLLSSILGPLQDLLTLIQSPLDILGAALKQIFDLLGISCSSASSKCASQDQTHHCTGPCGNNKSDKNFLDSLIESIENGNLDNSSGACSDIYSPPSVPDTTVSVIGGTTDPTGYTDTTPNTIPPTTTDPITTALESPPSPTILPSTIYPSTTPTTITPSTTPPTIVPSPGILTPLSVVNLSYTAASTITFSAPTTPSVVFKSGGISKKYVTSNTIINFSSSSTSQFNLAPSTISSITYQLSPDKLYVKGGETITFTLVANGGVVPNGTVFNYAMFGTISIADFEDGTTIGSMTMNNNIATKTLSIKNNPAITTDRVVSFNVIEAKTGRTFTIIPTVSASTTTTAPATLPAFKKPQIGTPEVCSDGRIMYIPIVDRGDRYIVPPIVTVSGSGFGASARAELNEEGYLKNILITRTGTGYKPTRQKNNCVISSIVISNPGIGYYKEPTVYVNGKSGVAAARINENGQLTKVEVINNTEIYDCTPRVEIFGGNGLGGSALAVMECRNDLDHQVFLQTVAPAGSGSVVDCP